MAPRPAGSEGNAGGGLVVGKVLHWGWGGGGALGGDRTGEENPIEICAYAVSGVRRVKDRKVKYKFRRIPCVNDTHQKPSICALYRILRNTQRVSF